MKKTILILFIFLVSACSSIPFGSMLKMASMNDSDLLSIKPEQVKTKITINEPAELQTKNIKLVLKFDYAASITKEYQFDLNLLSQNKIIDDNSWIFSAKTRHVYEFNIAEESYAEFKKYQQEFVDYGKPQKYFWTVYYYLKTRPENGELLNLDLELKLAENEAYFYLLKAAELDIK